VKDQNEIQATPVELAQKKFNIGDLYKEKTIKLQYVKYYYLIDIQRPQEKG
jgi:hypothetical protein